MSERWNYMGMNWSSERTQKAQRTLAGKLCRHAPEGFAVVDPETKETVGWAPARAEYCAQCLADVAQEIETEEQRDARIQALEERLDRLFREGGPGRGNVTE